MPNDLIIRAETEADYKNTELMTMRSFWNHQHSTQSVEVWCSHKVLQSDSIPFISTQSVGVLNPPHE